MAKVGQFKKGGGRVGDGRKSKKHKSTAIVRYVPKPVVRYKTRTHTVVKHSKGGGRALMKREHGGGEMVPGPFRLRSAAVSGLIGYAEAGKGLTAIADILNKLPEVGKIPKEAIAGFVLNYFADRGDWFDAGAQAFLDVGAYKFGQQGFAFSGDDDDY